MRPKLEKRQPAHTPAIKVDRITHVQTAVKARRQSRNQQPQVPRSARGRQRAQSKQEQRRRRRIHHLPRYSRPTPTQMKRANEGQRTAEISDRAPASNERAITSPQTVDPLPHLPAPLPDVSSAEVARLKLLSAYARAHGSASA
eukprot:6203541-Pleurochrysis_carterae.AAC.1